MTEPKEAQADRRVPVSMYRAPFERNPGHLESDEQLCWLADQLCSDTRVHPDRTMSCGFIPYQAAYEFPHLWDRFQALAAENAALREKLAEREALLRDAINAAANIAYVTCAKERHITLGDKVRDEIQALTLTGGDNAEG